MTPWNVLDLSLATSSTQTISPSPTVMSLNTWGGARGRDGFVACQLPPRSRSPAPGPAPSHWPRADCSGTPTLQVGTLSHRCQGICSRPPVAPPRPAQKGGQATAGWGQRLQGGGVDNSDSGTGRGRTRPGHRKDTAPITLPHARELNGPRGPSGPLSRISSTPAVGARPTRPELHGSRAGTSSGARRMDRPTARVACGGLRTPPLLESPLPGASVQAEL